MALTDNIVHYWKLDNNANDEVSGSSLSLTNTSYSTTTKLGTHSLLFSGTNGQMAASTIDIAGTNSISFSFWTKQTSTVADQLVFDPWSGANFLGQLRFVNGGTKLTCNVCRNGKYVTLANQATHSLTITNWNHFVITANTTTMVATLYINGNSAYSGSLASTLASNRVYVNFGNTSSADDTTSTDNSEKYLGHIDSIGIWSKELSSAEVTSLYNSGNGFDYPFSTAMNKMKSISKMRGLFKLKM